MPAIYEGAVQDLIDELGALPGIGPKSAQRIAFHILGADAADVNRLAQALTAVKAKVRFCETCGNVSEEEQCNICRDPRRDQGLICVVEEPKDVVAVERTREYRGLYHVLGGAIDPNIEGEATATYLARMLTSMNVPVSRLASGLPVGGDLEYADEITLGRAFEGRRRVE